jgi:hypothetical protein
VTVDDAKTAEKMTQLADMIRHVKTIIERKNFTLQIEVTSQDEVATETKSSASGRVSSGSR